MARYSCLALACALLIVVSAPDGYAQTATATAAAAAAKASPGLVGELSKQMGATPEQSAGAAGAWFGVAKTRLNANQFSQVPILVGFVTKSGGANVGNLLAGALK